MVFSVDGKRGLIHLQPMTKSDKIKQIKAEQAEKTLDIFAMLAEHGVTIINGQLVETIGTDEE
jgi:hypothetical protein